MANENPDVIVNDQDRWSEEFVVRDSAFAVAATGDMNGFVSVQARPFSATIPQDWATVLRVEMTGASIAPLQSGLISGQWLFRVGCAHGDFSSGTAYLSVVR